MRSSVLINSRNHRRFLAACLDSVLAQSRPADEIIVADNQSEDGTRELLTGYRDRVTVVECEHRASESAMANQARAIDAAFRRATGDVVLLLDGDDLFLPQKVDHFMAAFESVRAPVLVQAPLSWIDEGGAPLVRLPEPFRHVEDPLAATYRRQDLDFFYPTSALAFRRDFLLRVLPLDFSDGVPLASDTRLCAAAMLAGPIMTLPRELGTWRHHRSSHSRGEAGRRTHLVRKAWQRAAVFNRLCVAAGRPTISVWRSPRFYLRLLRVAAPFGRAWPWRART